MTTPAMIVLVGVLGLLALFLAGAMIGLRQPDVEPVLLDGDPTALHYCEVCGCRHRQMYMEWKPSGAYRCVACCLTKVG